MFFIWALASVGFLLIFLEFFLPGAIMAVGGSLLLLSSVFYFHMIDSRLFPLLGYLAFLLLATYGVIRLGLWKVRSEAKKGGISEDSQEGFQASTYQKELMGKTGVATTDLKPSGHICINDQLFEALSQTGYIDKGTPVLVLSGQGSHLIVKGIV